MSAIVPVSSNRVSDILVRQRLQNQLQSDQLAILRLQNQLSTGRRIELPSEDPSAALRGASVLRLLERKDQARKNIDANEVYLRATDSALSNTSNLLNDISASALGVVGAGSTDAQRQAIQLEVDAAIRELVDTGNQQIGDRYLFAGSQVNKKPFSLANNLVSYSGDTDHLSSYGDLDLLFETNLTGDQVFGGISPQVVGSADLNPTLKPSTRLANLNGGAGINKGTVVVSDGTNTKLVDLSRADTIGDVVALLEANPPAGRSIRVDVTATGLNVQIDQTGGGNLTIKEVGDGTTATGLGILRTATAGTAPIMGTDLQPRVSLTTQLSDLFGSRATTSIRPTGVNNALVFTATSRGATFNGVTVSFVDSGSVTAGSETAVYDASSKTLTVNIQSGITTANQVIAAVANEGTFSAAVDKHGITNNGSGALLATASDPLATGTTAGGTGFEFDQTSGLEIVNAGVTHVVDFSAAQTVEDLLNSMNRAETGVRAQINQAGNGIDIRSRISGADFQIGEHGGVTAEQLGVRSLSASTRLVNLNHGRGVQQADGTDFIIQRRDGTELNIDLDGATTIGDVLDLINNHPQNSDPATRVVARLARNGNGIELINDGPAGTNALVVKRVPQGQAAQDLGFIAVGADSQIATPGTSASATLDVAGPNNNIALTARAVGTSLNGVSIQFVDTGQGAGNETVTYDANAKTLVFDITDGVTTANDLVGLVNNDPTTSGLLQAQLASADGSPNTGAGTYSTTDGAVFAGGGSDSLMSRDANPLEVDGVFNALLRLSAALQSNDQVELQRSLELLDRGKFKLNFARADSGARQQALDAIKDRLGVEDTELRKALSNDIEADFTTVITELTARQTTFQATLQATAQTFKLSLLDYL